MARTPHGLAVPLMASAMSFL